MKTGLMPAMQPLVFMSARLSGPRLGVEAPTELHTALALALGGGAAFVRDLLRVSLTIRGHRLRSLEVESIIQQSHVGENMRREVLDV
jgi:hypothetical protein